jgi:sulfoquinovose isomerase
MPDHDDTASAPRQRFSRSSDPVAPRPLGWLSSREHRQWLRDEERRLLRFPTVIVTEEGDAAVFSRDGTPVAGRVARIFDSARLAHVYALAALRGEPGARSVAATLLSRLAGYAATGWPERADAVDEPQSLYTLSFVILAASTGVRIGHGPSEVMLEAALTRLNDVFSENGLALGRDRVDRHRDVSPYRGLNGNMHLTEALFAAADVTGDENLRARATSICEFVIRIAADREGRICEHFDANWDPQPELNRDRPDDAFVPYGATVGHGLEWARLIAQTAGTAPSGFLSAAISIFGRAVLDGWSVDGESGWIYTTDWTGRPVVRDRFHWVGAEAVGSAAVLWSLTGEERFAAHYEEWLDYAATHLIDRREGSWHHRLDATHRPVDDTSKPDLYHAYQAMLIPQLPVRTSVAQAVADGATSGDAGGLPRVRTPSR